MGWDEMILIFSNSLFLVGGKSILAHFMLHCSFYPILFFFLCNFSRFVFCPCSVICFLVCVFLSFLFLFLSRFLFLFLCLSDFVSKKNLFEFCLCLSYCILSYVHNFCFSLFEFCLGKNCLRIIKKGGLN